MATAYTLSPTHTQATGLQSESRQGSRKRKQDMPSAASPHTDGTTVSSAISQVQRPTQVNIDNISAAVEAVASFGYTKPLVKICALEMMNNGKVVTSGTLLEECENRYPNGCPELDNYSGIEDNNSALSEGEFSEADSSVTHQLSEAASPCLPPQPSQHNSSQYSLLPSGNASSSSSSRDNNFTNSRTSKGCEHSGSTGVNSYKNTISHSSAHSSSVSNGYSGEDCVDGHPMPSVGAVSSSLTQCNSGQFNDLNNPDLYSVSASLPLAAEDRIANLPGQNSGLPSRPQPSGHYFNQQSNTSPSHAQNSSGGLKAAAASDTTRLSNLASGIELEGASAYPVRESMPARKMFSQSNADFKRMCFELVEKEHALLEKSRLCSLCLCKPRNVTFLPCGHFTSCRECAEPTYVCPCCNRAILATVDTYLS